MRPLIAILLLLAVASALSLVLIPRFEVLQVDAVADPSLSTLAAPGGSPVWLPVGGGRIEPVPSGVRIANDDLDGFAGVEQMLEIPEGATGYRVTATVKLEDVVSSPEPWQRVWILVSGIGQDRQPSLSGPLLVDAEGSFGPRRLSAVFWLGQGVDQAVLMLRLQRSAGVMEVRDLEVEAVLDYDSTHPHPLVFGFHGRTNPNTQVRRYFGLEPATAMRAIYVYPQGLEDETGRFTWADPGDPADELRDYALFDEILDTMAEAYCVDLAAVFVAGHSLGATFANSVACARADVVRGVGSVAGGINPAECPEEVAALLLHNPRDEAVPLAEGERARDHLLSETDGLAAAEPRSLGGFDCRQYTDGENPLLWCLYRQDMARTGRFYPHQWPDGAGETIMRFFQDLRG